MKAEIKVPCSSANIGPGFDVVGISLSLYLRLDISVLSNESYACQLVCEGEGADEIPTDPHKNFITQIAIYVLRCHGINKIPHGTRILFDNQIPLGRGLGSSGAAVVAGVMLGNLLGNLSLSKDRMLDYCLMIERHPDNVAAAMMGGFVGSFLRELDAKDMERKEIPLSEVLPEPVGGIDTGVAPPEPPIGIGHYIKYGWASELKAIAIIPQFEVSTAKARQVLPDTYSKADLVFNMQRLAVLTTALTRSPPDPELIHQAMQDRVHQPYRKTLIPGLPDVLASVTPISHPGLCGICLSGAGPTILALATDNFKHIADTIIQKFQAENITCIYKILEPAYDGATSTVVS